jgi:mono/diheme cytochrome c family protein
MNKVFKVFGYIFGALIGLIALLLVVTNYLASARINRQYDVKVAAVAVPSDAAALARGQHLAEVVSHCSACHGPDLGGAAFFDNPAIGSFSAPNLTSGQGGIGSQYSDADWVRAMTHGLAPDGRALVILPAQYFRLYSDADLGAIIAYVKSVPPVDRQVETKKLTVMGKMLFALGALGSMPAEIIDHNAPRPAAPPPGVSAEYGGLLVNVAVCKECHGDNLAGGSPGPGMAWASNLTPGGDPGGWSEADFIAAMRTGITPSGQALIPEMPWQLYGKMTDEELRAAWLYLQSLPALAENKP